VKALEVEEEAPGATISEKSILTIRAMNGPEILF
jgi:hypothetical protein